MKKGKFIVFEGIDGSGKSSQAKALYNNLSDDNIPVELTAEPTESEIGKLIRRALKGEVPIPTEALGALYVADRITHLKGENGILQKLNSGINVICDRYVYSSLAYNSISTSTEYIKQINAPCMESLTPDIVFFLEINPDKAIQRMSKKDKDIFERCDYLSIVRTNYHKIFKDIKRNVFLIDAEKEFEVVANEIALLFRLVDSL